MKQVFTHWFFLLISASVLQHEGPLWLVVFVPFVHLQVDDQLSVRAPRCVTHIQLRKPSWERSVSPAKANQPTKQDGFPPLSETNVFLQSLNIIPCCQDFAAASDGTSELFSCYLWTRLCSCKIGMWDFLVLFWFCHTPNPSASIWVEIAQF